MQKNPPTVLVILDGYGIGQASPYNPIFKAHKPHLDEWFAHYPHAELKASGSAVGLPPGSIGNSEVGHLTMGSGRVIDQSLTVFNNAIVAGTLAKNTVLLKSLDALQRAGTTLHCMGLLSDAGVHSNINHLYALLKIAADFGLAKIIVHPFLDGRDVAVQSAAYYLTQLEEAIKNIPAAQLGSIHGRFYALDRDHNWERTERSYRTLTQVQQNQYSSWRTLLAHWYAQGVTDEFIPPTQNHQHTIVQQGDGIIFFNIRPDRARQLTESFVQDKFSYFERKKIDLTFFITPFFLGNTVKNTTLFERSIIHNTLFDVLARAGKRIFASAETEKYAHITYFFNGGREELVPHEKRILIPSLDVGHNYIEHPCMSAAQITAAVVDSLRTDAYDFYLINYANADMVGHSGNFNAIVHAIECLDRELGTLYREVVEKRGGTLFIAADHGNAEKLFDGSVQALTAHTTSKVPFLMIQKNLYNAQTNLPLVELADIAPFILKHLGLQVPPEMQRR